jgi:hypothetical protein
MDLWALGLPRFEMVLACLMIALLAAVDAAIATGPPRVARGWERRAFRWACYLRLPLPPSAFTTSR